MATDLVTIATTAVLSQFLGPSAKHLGEELLERGKKVGSKAASLLAAVGREPEPVEPKLLIPLVQAASLETDESLSDKWAALLANAADPAQQVRVQPGFAEVLRQLTPVDAQILERVYSGVTADTFQLGNEPESIIVESYAKEMGLSLADFGVYMDNLLRLRLCGPRTRAFNVEQYSVALTPAVWVVPTRFGQAFLLACASPNA